MRHSQRWQPIIGRNAMWWMLHPLWFVASYDLSEYRHTDGVTEIAFYVLSNYWPQKTFRRRYFHLRKRRNQGSGKSSWDLAKYLNWTKSWNNPTLRGTFLLLFLWLLLFCSMYRTNKPHFVVCKWCVIITIPTVSHSTIAEHNSTKYTGGQYKPCFVLDKYICQPFASL